MLADRTGEVIATNSERPNGIIPLIISKPQDAWLSNVSFGGSDFNTLIVTCDDKVYKRKINAAGARMSEASKVPKPNL
ncbi:MAG: hypothetical protein HYV60_00340 [Planctomycetia bacterium]|nr:hypothetical protein [Planctomycetia bacterium]